MLSMAVSSDPSFTECEIPVLNCRFCTGQIRNRATTAMSANAIVPPSIPPTMALAELEAVVGTKDCVGLSECASILVEAVEEVKEFLGTMDDDRATVTQCQHVRRLKG